MTVKSDGAAVLDEKTGVLTLSGKVTRDQILSFRYSKVTSVIAEKGTVLPADCSALFSRYGSYYAFEEEDGGEAEGSFWRYIESFDLSEADTTGVTDMRYMFAGCERITVLDLSSFDTANTSEMRAMFYACRKLKTLDISGFDTSKVTGMRDMFGYCSLLETVSVSDKWTLKNVKDSENMFCGCEKLKGGNGTVFDEEFTDGRYACADRKGTPGYFTLKTA